MPVLAVAEIYNNLKPSARGLVDDVHKYMEKVLWKLTEDVAYAFPRLKAAIKALVSSCRSVTELSNKPNPSLMCTLCLCARSANVHALQAIFFLSHL